MPIRKINPLVGIVPICRGCLGDCTYCITRFARGGLVSYSSEGVVERVSDLVSSGCREIWLTAQDTGADGLDIGLRFCAEFVIYQGISRYVWV